MKISDILVEKTPHLSFEVFPPKTDAAYEGVFLLVPPPAPYVTLIYDGFNSAKQYEELYEGM